MAYIGVRKPYISKRLPTGKYEAKIAVGKATSFTETPNTGTADLYGDDALAESERGVTSAALSLGTTDLPEAAEIAMFGHTKAEDEMVANVDDTAPYCGFAVIGVKKVNGVKSYEVRAYPKTQWAESETSLTTRGENTEFQTPSTNGTAMADDDGNWRFKEEFETEALALAYIDTKFPTT